MQILFPWKEMSRKINLLQRHHRTQPIALCYIDVHGKECWRKILDAWIDLCERKRVSQLREVLFVSLATFVSNFRGAAAQFTGIATFELWTDIGSCPL